MYNLAVKHDSCCNPAGKARNSYTITASTNSGVLQVIDRRSSKHPTVTHTQLEVFSIAATNFLLMKMSKHLVSHDSTVGVKRFVDLWKYDK